MTLEIGKGGVADLGGSNRARAARLPLPRNNGPRVVSPRDLTPTCIFLHSGGRYMWPAAYVSYHCVKRTPYLHVPHWWSGGYRRRGRVHVLIRDNCSYHGKLLAIFKKKGL